MRIDALDNFLSVEHNSKFSVLVPRQFLEKSFDAGKDTISSIHLLEQNFLILQYTFFLKIGDPMNKAINRKISQLIESGIIQKLENDRSIEINKLKQDQKAAPTPSEVGVLTMDQLGICFFAILICLSFVVFVLECATGFVLKRLNKRQAQMKLLSTIQCGV
jgi:hypothetical protein